MSLTSKPMRKLFRKKRSTTFSTQLLSFLPQGRNSLIQLMMLTLTEPQTPSTSPKTTIANYSCLPLQPFSEVTTFRSIAHQMIPSCSQRPFTASQRCSMKAWVNTIKQSTALISDPSDILVLSPAPSMPLTELQITQLVSNIRPIS